MRLSVPAGSTWFSLCPFAWCKRLQDGLETRVSDHEGRLGDIELRLLNLS